MSRRIGLVAALPSELKPLVKDWQRERTAGNVSGWTKTDGKGNQYVAVCAGMGANAARRAFAAAEAYGALDAVISLGLAGATTKGAEVAQVRRVSEIVDVQTGERFRMADAGEPALLATVAQPADPREKRRLWTSYGAALVDMEAATVARMAAMRSMPMYCFKAVSDTAEAELPAIERFVDSEGQLSVPRFLVHLAMRPRQWPGIVRLARHSSRASAALAAHVAEFLSRADG